MSRTLNAQFSQALQACGWLRLDEPEASTAAREDHRMKYPAAGMVGVDVGGTKIHAITMRQDGARGPLAERIVATDPTGGRAVLAQVARLATDLCGDTPRGVALACPGAFDPATGHVDQAPNLRGWDGLDIAGELETLLGAPVLIHNDVLLAAKAEAAIRGVGDLAFLALGTGVGVGLILGGQPRAGARGQAGEICHLPIGADPFNQDLHVRGVLESRLSGARILAEYAALGGQACDVPGIFEKAARGESAAKQSLGSTARLLALTVRTVVSVIDPEIVVLGGGIGARVELTGLVDAELDRTGGGPVDLRRSALGSRAAAIGALMARYEASFPRDEAAMYTSRSVV